MHYLKTRALETIERNAKLQTELIEDLLDISRILQGKLTLNIAPVNLETAIASAIETVRLAAQAKSINLQFTISDFPAERYANAQSFSTRGCALSVAMPQALRQRSGTIERFWIRKSEYKFRIYRF